MLGGGEHAAAVMQLQLAQARASMAAGQLFGRLAVPERTSGTAGGEQEAEQLAMGPASAHGGQELRQYEDMLRASASPASLLLQQRMSMAAAMHQQLLARASAAPDAMHVGLLQLAASGLPAYGQGWPAPGLASPPPPAAATAAVAAMMPGGAGGGQRTAASWAAAADAGSGLGLHPALAARHTWAPAAAMQLAPPHPSVLGPWLHGGRLSGMPAAPAGPEGR